MVIAFVPLRGGSKSIPLKNIKLLNGKPLAYWVLHACEACLNIDKIVVATDSEEIKEVIKNFKFVKLEVYDRQPTNAEDTSSTEAVMLEYLSAKELAETDTFILLQATNPFTNQQYLQEALTLFLKEPKGSVITCAKNKRFFWREDGAPINYDWQARPRRQDFHGQMIENGAFYINTVGNIIKNKNRLSEPISIFEMPEYTSYEIDEPEDWIIVESLLQRVQQ